MNDLDSVLKEVGQFGNYQIYTYILLFFPLALSSAASISYLFSAGDIGYRCLIPECERNDTDKYDQPWLSNAMPYKDGALADHCLRYVPKSNLTDGTCSKDLFTNKIETCDEFVFENDENTITKEFNLLCDENNWKRTLIGTLNNIGLFIAMPIAGIVSDRFGRKTMLIGSLTLSAIFGTIRSFATSYPMFVAFEMLDAMAYSGVYSGVFVFGIEIIGPEMRGIGGAIISIYYSVGEIILGFIVWYVHDWRQFLRLLYIPSFLFLIYIWILPESIRWLVGKGKKEKVMEAVERMSRWNKKAMTDGLKKTIESICSQEAKEVTEKKPLEPREEKPKRPLVEAMKSNIILLRLFSCSFCWITHTFVFYGLSLNSTSIAGNKYLNFILVSFVEIPAYLMACFMINYAGRKLSLCLGLAISGGACTAFHFIDQGNTTMKLILYFTGKLAITESFSALYVIASEVYPTYMRHSLLGFCSTMGRIGSMLAPQMPLMSKYVDPVLVFGAFSFAAAALGLTFPETKNCAMPETLKDAEELGKKVAPRQQRNEESATKAGVSA